MAHSDDATKAWVSAIPTKDENGKVTDWRLKYKYTLAVGTNKGNIMNGEGEFGDDYIYTFDKTIKFKTPLKAPTDYTKSELLDLLDTDWTNDQFNRKYAGWTAVKPTKTVDNSFDVTGLND